MKDDPLISESNVTVSGPAPGHDKFAWRHNPWLVFLGPFVLFMLLGTLEPAAPPTESELRAGGVAANQPVDEAAPKLPSEPWLDLGIEYRHYPIIYTVKILLVALAVAAVWQGYPRLQRINPLAYMVGILGVVAWITLAYAQRWLEAASGLGPTIDGWLGGRRAGFNPLEQLADQPAWAWGFLAIRFLGLAAVVPVIEEMFLRGFVSRFPVANDWWRVPIGQYDLVGLIAVIALPILMHPHEALAAVVWFGAVAWLLLRTKNVWDCVVAHAITNLLLGVYVVANGEWWLM